MIIESFIIEGFSNIEHIRLDVGGINALIAPNGYGKSNILSAISFGLMYLNANEETKGQMLRSRFLPINVSIKEKKFHFEIHGRLQREGRTELVQYGYECQFSCFLFTVDTSERTNYIFVAPRHHVNDYHVPTFDVVACLFTYIGIKFMN